MRGLVVTASVLAIGLATACTSKDPETLKQEYLASGDRYIAHKRYPEAIIQYRNAIAQDNRFGEARFKLGSAYQESGDLTAALREYVRAADLMPKDARVQVRAGTFLLGAGDYEGAQARATAALAVEPKNPTALILMGNAMARLKDLDGAITQVESAIEAEPRFTFAYANLGLMEASKGNMAGAEGAFKRAVDVAPDSVSAHVNLGNFYWAIGKRDLAEASLRAALKLDPKSVEVNRLMAAFFVTNGQDEQGEPFLRTFAGLVNETQPKLALADFYLTKSRNAEAVAVLDALRKTDDGFVPATRRLAGMAFADGRRPESYRLIEEALKKAPTDEMTLHTKASFLLAEDKVADALAVADAVVQKNDRAVRTNYLRALAHRRLGNIDAAIAAARDAQRHAPISALAQGLLTELYLDKGDGKAALELSSQLVRRQPRSGPAQFLLGRALLLSGNAKAAETQLAALAKAQPASPDLHIWLARANLAQDKRGPARQAFTKALELQPGSLLALNGLVALDMAEGKSDAVIARLETELAKGPRTTPLVFMAANTYFALRNMQKAEALFDEVVRLDPNQLDAYARLASIYLSQSRLDDARRKYEEIAKRQDRPVAETTLVGMVLELQKKPEEAKVQYQRALELDPRAGVAANNLAWLYAERGENLDVALQLAQTAKAALPTNANVANTLGWVYYKKGLFSQALSEFKQSVDSSPNDAAKQYYLGLAYLKTDQQSEARRALERALKLNPQFPYAADARQVLATVKG